MNYLVAGLGNPGKEYEKTRHNIGHDIVADFAATHAFTEWKNDKRAQGAVAMGEIAGEKVTALLPDTFMNNSGESVRMYVKTPKDAEKLIVVHDDFDLPLGTYKMSFNRGSGGHNGVQSIIDHLKTEAFIRVRVGVSPMGKDGILKKPHGEKEVHNFVLGTFGKSEATVLSKTMSEVDTAICALISLGKEKAMSLYN
jgi:PTH1 family peptidyl-tRNA hydrolase